MENNQEINDIIKQQRLDKLKIRMSKGLIKILKTFIAAPLLLMLISWLVLSLPFGVTPLTYGVSVVYILAANTLKWLLDGKYNRKAV